MVQVLEVGNDPCRKLANKNNSAVHVLSKTLPSVLQSEQRLSNCHLASTIHGESQYSSNKVQLLLFRLN